MKQHIYHCQNQWRGNQGTGTDSYVTYSRDFELNAKGKPQILGSSDPHFRGDASRWNPEDMMVSAVSSCHMLWYLHLCAVAGVVVTDYVDDAEGVMVETTDGGFFEKGTLRPKITITPDSSEDAAMKLHQEAHHYCFIANSVNFEIVVEAQIKQA